MDVLNVMEIDNQQKMAQTGKQECVSICSELNLNPNKLQVQSLMSNVTYRRLYNIVRNDMSRSDLAFRKNLIKELYFLLQITPIIKSQLTDHFLSQVQRWYNLNDHKKIDLASSKLNDLLSIVHHSRKDVLKGENQRPKTGGAWNINVSPFLRPYTASRERPESSKLGQSTRGDTNQFCIREFTTNIQEELKMSQDFLQKHRTNHPDYEPTYEQLYHILKKVERHSQDQTIQTSQPSNKLARYSKSALPRRPQEKTVVLRENPQSDPHIEAEEGEGEPVENEEQRDSESSSSSEDEQVLYVSDKRQQPSHALKLIPVPSPNAEPRPDGLQKYMHCMEQKIVQALREDRQMAANYVGFARAKTAFRRELNRKNQSRRLLSAKQNAREYRTKHISLGEKEREDFKCKVVDLTADPLSLPADAPNPHPTYNRHKFLDKRYAEPVKRFKKLNNTEELGEKVRGNVKRPMTACVRFHSPIKFDPLSPDNVATYNLEVLEEIQKIKLRMGGKCSASTDSLMKALYVDAAPEQARWQDLSPYFGMVSSGKEKKKLKKRGRKMKSKPKLTSK